MKKILALLIALVSFGFCACKQQPNNGGCLYGPPPVDYQENDSVNDNQDVDLDEEYPEEVFEDNFE